MNRQFLSIALILIVTLASIGFNVSAHLCQGEVMAVALFTEVEACEAMGAGTCSEHDNNEGFNRIPCCTNLQFCSIVSDFESNSFVKIDALSVKLFPTPYTIIPDIIQADIFSYSKFDNGPPNENIQDVLALYQVYLI